MKLISVETLPSYPSKPKKHHRLTFDKIAGEFDEAWISGADVHIERMSDTTFWIGITPPEGSGLPTVMLNTGVHKGEWFFNLYEDCLDDAKDVTVRRPRNSKTKLPKKGPDETTSRRSDD